MRKAILSIAMLAALLVTCCKNSTKSESSEGTKTETASEKNDDTAKATAETSDGVPDFSDADVQDYVDAYESYMEEYKSAVESKDMTAFSALATKGQELASKAQEVSGKVSGADAEKLTNYMTEKAKELQELSKKMME